MQSVNFRANYATAYVGAHLGPAEGKLNLEWATDAGDETELTEFEVPTDSPADPYVGLQAFDVGEYGHEIIVNDEVQGGFDIPPNDGWQYWIDTLTDVALRKGRNTIRIARDTATDDAFAVGTVTIHWKEPVD